LSQNANFFAEFFGENILKIITSVPGDPACEIAEAIFNQEETDPKDGCF
jgi:hypothetical protein